jgi:hypothetical protein
MSRELLESPSRRDLMKGAASLGLASLFQAWHVREARAALRTPARCAELLQRGSDNHRGNPNVTPTVARQ